MSAVACALRRRGGIHRVARRDQLLLRSPAGSRGGRRSPTFWRGYTRSCAGAIAAAVVWIVVTALVGEPSKALLIGEAVAVWAFGASWLMKGLELDFLRRR